MVYTVYVLGGNNLEKNRKHFNTVYMYDKTMLGRVANKIPTNEIKGKNVIEFYPGFGLLSTRYVLKFIPRFSLVHFFSEFSKKSLYLILLSNLTSEL